MDRLAGVVEHLAYEFFGLLLPGAALFLGVAAAYDEATFVAVISFAGEQPWISLGTFYLAGYPLQAWSRALVTVWERTFGRGFGKPAASAKGLHRVEATGPGTEVRDALVERLSVRFLPKGPSGSLPDHTVEDLAFSVMVADRLQADRFRAATSLCRAVGAAAMLAWAVLLIRILLTSLPTRSWPSFPEWLAMLVLPFVIEGFRQRATMYHSVRRRLIETQALVELTTASGASGETS